MDDEKINEKQQNQKVKNEVEGLLGVLKDEEEKKEEEMEQKMREEKEFKKFETEEIEYEEIKQDEEKEEEKDEEEKEEQKLATEEKETVPKKNEIILPNEEDESKKLFKINNNNNIKEIIIYNTINNPDTRCYLTTEYSSKNNKIICIGGSDINSEQYNKINEYDTKENKWIIHENTPESFNIKLSGHTSNLININEKEKIFLYGGFNDFSEDYTNHGFLINTENFTFEDINFNKNLNGKSEIPCSRSYHTANYDNEKQKIYIYGGTDLNISNSKSENFQSLYQYDIETKCWKKIILKNTNPMGAPRGHTSILHKNKLYIFGGILLFKKFQNSLYTIDLQNYQIEKIDYNNEGKNITPKPVAFHSAIKIDENKFLTQGGLNEKYNVVNDCYFYYFNENIFEKVEIPILPKLFGHKLNLDTEKGSIFIIGGMDSFKYLGDENLICTDDDEDDDENPENKIVKEDWEELQTTPMVNVFEIVLNNYINVNKKENSEVKAIEKIRNNKKIKWIKYYV